MAHDISFLHCHLLPCTCRNRFARVEMNEMKMLFIIASLATALFCSSILKNRLGASERLLLCSFDKVHCDRAVVGQLKITCSSERKTKEVPRDLWGKIHEPK